MRQHNHLYPDACFLERSKICLSAVISSLLRRIQASRFVSAQRVWQNAKYPRHPMRTARPSSTSSNGRAPEKLPPVLDADEIVRFLESVAGLRNRVALTTAYAAGLRIGEVALLKVAAIDRAHPDPGRERQGRQECGPGLPPPSDLRTRLSSVQDGA